MPATTPSKVPLWHLLPESMLWWWMGTGLSPLLVDVYLNMMPLLWLGVIKGIMCVLLQQHVILNSLLPHISICTYEQYMNMNCDLWSLFSYVNNTMHTYIYIIPIIPYSNNICVNGFCVNTTLYHDTSFSLAWRLLTTQSSNFPNHSTMQKSMQFHQDVTYIDLTKLSQDEYLITNTISFIANT